MVRYGGKDIHHLHVAEVETCVGGLPNSGEAKALRTVGSPRMIVFVGRF